MASAAAALTFLAKYNSVDFGWTEGRYSASTASILQQKMALAVDDKLLLLGGVMLVMGLLAVVFWDSLMLGPRDHLVLGPLPVRPGAVFLAKLVAVGAAAALVAVALKAGSRPSGCSGPPMSSGGRSSGARSGRLHRKCRR